MQGNSPDTGKGKICIVLISGIPSRSSPETEQLFRNLTRNEWKETSQNCPEFMQGWLQIKRQPALEANSQIKMKWLLKRSEMMQIWLTDKGTGLSSPNFKPQQVRDLQDKLLQHFLVHCCQSCTFYWDLSLADIAGTKIWELSISCYRAAHSNSTSFIQSQETSWALPQGLLALE